MKLELTPQEGSMLVAGAGKGLNRETFITGLLRRPRA
jgi:hypothetical protein